MIMSEVSLTAAARSNRLGNYGRCAVRGQLRRLLREAPAVAQLNPVEQVEQQRGQPERALDPSDVGVAAAARHVPGRGVAAGAVAGEDGGLPDAPPGADDVPAGGGGGQRGWQEEGRRGDAAVAEPEQHGYGDDGPDHHQEEREEEGRQQRGEEEKNENHLHRLPARGTRKGVRKGALPRRLRQRGAGPQAQPQRVPRAGLVPESPRQMAEGRTPPEDRRLRRQQPPELQHQLELQPDHPVHPIASDQPVAERGLVVVPVHVRPRPAPQPPQQQLRLVLELRLARLLLQLHDHPELVLVHAELARRAAVPRPRLPGAAGQPEPAAGQGVPDAADALAERRRRLHRREDRVRGARRRGGGPVAGTVRRGLAQVRAGGGLRRRAVEGGAAGRGRGGADVRRATPFSQLAAAARRGCFGGGGCL